MTSAKFLRILRDFVPEYHHATFGCNWTTNKGETEGGTNEYIYIYAFMVRKDPSLNRVTLPAGHFVLNLPLPRADPPKGFSSITFEQNKLGPPNFAKCNFNNIHIGGFDQI